eukprot:GDKI01030149.1.p1 GENE.GDKI01030149.1~~GDKI01030149.1.p1  ORF type:complete len:126 (-),score=45.32 GDKI01030149.1:436-813(-)
MVFVGPILFTTIVACVFKFSPHPKTLQFLAYWLAGPLVDHLCMEAEGRPRDPIPQPLSLANTPLRRQITPLIPPTHTHTTTQQLQQILTAPQAFTTPTSARTRGVTGGESGRLADIPKMPPLGGK